MPPKTHITKTNRKGQTVHTTWKVWTEHGYRTFDSEEKAYDYFTNNGGERLDKIDITVLADMTDGRSK